MGMKLYGNKLALMDITLASFTMTFIFPISAKCSISFSQYLLYLYL